MQKTKNKSDHLGETNQTWHREPLKPYIKNSQAQHVVFFHLLDCLFTVLLFTFCLQDGNLSATINFRNTGLDTEITLIC